MLTAAKGLTSFGHRQLALPAAAFSSFSAAQQKNTNNNNCNENSGKTLNWNGPLSQVDPEMAEIIANEKKRQFEGINLIASEVRREQTRRKKACSYLSCYFLYRISQVEL